MEQESGDQLTGLPGKDVYEQALRETIVDDGADEFAVILRSTEKERAFLRLEKERGAVKNFNYGDTMDATPTICIGVATFPDDALYRAKTDGRNHVTLACEEKKNRRPAILPGGS